MTAERVVADTNILISALLSAHSGPRRPVQMVLDGQLTLLQSEPTYRELVTRLERPKFDRYRDREAWDMFLSELIELVAWYPDIAIDPVSRDADDDKFLALAVTGRADAIVSGDQDLLILKAYEGVPIISVTEFLKRHS